VAAAVLAAAASLAGTMLCAEEPTTRGGAERLGLSRRGDEVTSAG